MMDLLNKTHFITDKYEEIEKLNGEQFNIFKLFGLTSKEVSTHSKFIGELLNPKGSHNLNENFLKLFINLESISYNNFNVDNAFLKVEKYIGNISSDFTEGGSIDIFLSDGKNTIIIENKVFAKEQNNQISRYYNYAKKNYGDQFKIFYLTLDGKEPTIKDIKDKNIYTLSYKDDIIEWLELCKEKAVNYPIIRETITQYIYILKELTNQTNNKIMAEEIINTITNNESNLKSFFNLQKNNVIHGVKSKLLEEFRRQMEEVAKELDMIPDFDNKFGLRKRPTYLKFHYKNSMKGFYYSICFVHQDKHLIYQIDCKNTYRSQVRDKVLSCLPERSKKFNEIWVRWFEDDLRNWDSSSRPWLMIKDGSLKEKIKLEFEAFASNLKDIEK